MLNPFVIRKWTALLITGLLNPIFFYIGLIFYGFLGGLGFLAGGLLISVLLGFFLLKNPFTGMLEGSGILAIDITSTGILKPFLVSVQGAYVKGKANKTDIIDVFDRNAVMNLAPPIKVTKPATWEDGKLKIELDENEYNQNRFGLFQYPCLLYNSAVGSFVTKDFLSEGEKTVFAEHSILYVKRRLEDLTSAVRDFGRHIVEQLKPQSSIFKNKWFVVIVIIMCVLLIAMFAPAVIEQIGGQGFFGQASAAIGQAGNAATVQPIG